ncbi:endonuclease domain-containing protein [Streptomyces sp. MB09-02B]|uniref:endonuclease domain-containing protein n=1 Tax=Streptomyces sp. MB09-02B TaxID=3028667 RepID=UPI0029BF113A|nr:endonuclease domain-containing protein [Streptomyces sp. MB09-02B]MDX3645315.1 endonuclease domain-containing protein [Streptomyces sp. MB09-02B]
MTTRTTWARNTKPEVPCVGDNAPRACRHRHRRYGMTCADYAALLRRSGGKCEICRVPGIETSHGYLVIDHDYAYGFSGGAVRGLLCSPCNTRIAYPTNGAHAEAKAQYLASPWHLERPAPSEETTR